MEKLSDELCGEMILMREFFKNIRIFFPSLSILCLFFLPFPAETEKPAPSLILQWEMSHFTGERQVSLVFTADRVDLFTNTSLWQERGAPPRLGRFTSPLNEKWQVERDRISVYLSLLKDRPPVTLLLKEHFPKNLAELIQESPHAPVVRLNGYEVREGDSYFSILEEIFPLIWKNQWACVDCVIYKNRRKGIERRRIFEDGTVNKTLFSHERLNCYSIGGKRLECADTQGGPTGSGWGGFQIDL